MRLKEKDSCRMRYEASEEERKYLENYDISMYDRPSIATDIVVFTVGKEEVENTRQHPKGVLRVLMINRASYPYKNMWALPGGFCRKNEEVHQTAKRELYEETHIEDAYLKVSGIYGDVNRDPRGWIISHAYLALVDATKIQLRADTDAWDAKWFDMDVSMTQIDKQINEKEIYIQNKYVLTLRCDDEILSGTILENRSYVNYHETVTYEIVKCEGIAFDHAKIIVNAFQKLQSSAERDEKIIFDLMPELFTLTQLQNIFEVILQRELLKPNFRRKIAEYVIETDDVESGRRYRTAKLFRRNIEKFIQ